MKTENKIIRVHLRLPNGEDERNHFDYNRNDLYTSIADSGFEDLDMNDDLAKIMLYMNNDIICFNNGRMYKVISREFQPCRPMMLYLNVEEM